MASAWKGPTIGHKCFQTPDFVGIDITCQLKNREDLKTKIEKKWIEISFPLDNPGNKVIKPEYEIKMDLFDEIIPEKTEINHNPNLIEIIL